MHGTTVRIWNVTRICGMKDQGCPPGSSDMSLSLNVQSVEQVV